jgi:hypothetical protein
VDPRRWRVAVRAVRFGRVELSGSVRYDEFRFVAPRGKLRQQSRRQPAAPRPVKPARPAPCEFVILPDAQSGWASRMKRMQTMRHGASARTTVRPICRS